MINALPAGVSFTMASFCHQIAFISEPPRLMPATPDNKKKAVDWVRGLEAMGETWTDTVLERTLGEIPDVDTVFLLSDGMPFRNGAFIDKDKVREEIKVLNRFVKARINTIGFIQEGMNLQKFLMGVAAENDGKYTPLK